MSLGLDDPLAALPAHSIPANAPQIQIVSSHELQDAAADASSSPYVTEKTVAIAEPPDAPEEKKRRIDVDDPLADPREVIAQLKADLARVHNSLKLAANAQFKLSLREQECAELKRQLQHARAAKEDPPAPSNHLLNDYLVVSALAKQAAEIQRLKEDVERERDFNEARKFNPSQLGSLKLVARVHALVKENAELGEDLAHEEAPDKWSVIDLYKQFIERTRAETEETVQHTAKLKRQIQEAELATFQLQQTAKAADPSGSRPRRGVRRHPEVRVVVPVLLRHVLHVPRGPAALLLPTAVAPPAPRPPILLIVDVCRGGRLGARDMILVLRCPKMP
eukprot:EG_transcript_13669